MKYTFFALFIGLLIASCDSSQSQKERTVQSSQEEKDTSTILYADLYMRYMAENNSVKAQANFKEGLDLKTAQNKKFKGGVSFQGSGMEEKNLQGKLIRYEANRYGDLTPPYRFGFDVNGQGKKIFNANISAIGNFEIKQHDKYLTISCTDGKLTKEEHLVVLFSDKDNTAASVVIPGPSTSNSHNIMLEQIQQLASGDCKVYLVKKRLEKRKEENLDLRIDTEYYTTSIDFKLKK